MGALYGPLHGGANEAVLRMLERIGSVDKIGPFLEGVKARKEKMFGFGHRCARPCTDSTPPGDAAQFGVRAAAAVGAAHHVALLVDPKVAAAPCVAALHLPAQHKLLGFATCQRRPPPGGLSSSA